MEKARPKTSKIARPGRIEGPSQIVDERREAELSPDNVEVLHQKGALVHPLLNADEGMFDGLWCTATEEDRHGMPPD